MHKTSIRVDPFGLSFVVPDVLEDSNMFEGVPLPKRYVHFYRNLVVL